MFICVNSDVFLVRYGCVFVIFGLLNTRTCFRVVHFFYHVSRSVILLFYLWGTCYSVFGTCCSVLEGLLVYSDHVPGGIFCYVMRCSDVLLFLLFACSFVYCDVQLFVVLSDLCESWFQFVYRACSAWSGVVVIGF